MTGRRAALLTALWLGLCLALYLRLLAPGLRNILGMAP